MHTKRSVCWRMIVQVKVGKLCQSCTWETRPVQDHCCCWCSDTSKALNTWHALIRSDTKMSMVTQMMTILTVLMLNTVGSSLTSDEKQSVTQYLNRFGYQANKNLSQAIRSEVVIWMDCKIFNFTPRKWMIQWLFLECSSVCQALRRQESSVMPSTSKP